jgi:hypothetical protein
MKAVHFKCGVKKMFQQLFQVALHSPPTDIIPTTETQLALPYKVFRVLTKTAIYHKNYIIYEVTVSIQFAYH